MKSWFSVYYYLFTLNEILILYIIYYLSVYFILKCNVVEYYYITMYIKDLNELFMFTNIYRIYSFIN